MKIRQSKVRIFQEDRFEEIRLVVECWRCTSIFRAKNGNRILVNSLIQYLINNDGSQGRLT